MCSFFAQPPHNSNNYFDRKPTRNREPKEEVKAVNAGYSKKWYQQSIPITKKEKRQFDQLTRKGYSIYEAFIKEKTNNRYSKTPKSDEYFLVPSSIKVRYVQKDNINTTSKEEKTLEEIEIEDFRPLLKNKNTLYYTKAYKDSFPDFSLKYGVNPHLSIRCPFMMGGDRYLESAPKVNEIKLHKKSNEITIYYSSGTRDIRSLYKLKRGKLAFIRNIYVLAID